ncbi:hypothetical protein LTR27_010872 [Elasticomyces elasticus]|nr:hypothetical protein LTR27_010872 [Elasticomyces elasticus]
MALTPRRPFGDITPSFIKATSKKATSTETTSTKVTSKKTTTMKSASKEAAVEGNVAAKKTAAGETATDRIATKEKTIKTTAELVLEFERDLYRKREPAKKKTAKHDFKIYEDIEIYEDPEPVIDTSCTGPTSVSPAVVERINFINYLATKDMGRNPNQERYDPVSGMMVGEMIDEFAEMFGSLGAPWANLEEYDSYVWEMELLRNMEEPMGIWELEDCELPTEEPFAEWETDNDSGVGLPTEEPFAEWEEGYDSAHVKESDLPQSLPTEEPFAEWEEENDSSLHALLLKEREHQALEDAERAEWEERVNWKE